MAERILPTTAPASIPATHAYNDPDLSPVEFLKAVYHATHLPMATRIEAASALLPFTEPKPRATPPITCTIRIEGISPEDNGNSQSRIRSQEYNPQPRCGDPNSINIDDDPPPPTFKPFLSTPGISYIEKTFPSLNTETSSNTLYSEPPSTEEIQQIASAVHALQPNFDHLPTPEFHLCPCGHWITGEFDCCRALSSRDPSKMN
jgi:hypothetical protein